MKLCLIIALVVLQNTQKFIPANLLNVNIGENLQFAIECLKPVLQYTEPPFPQMAHALCTVCISRAGGKE